MGQPTQTFQSEHSDKMRIIAGKFRSRQLAAPKGWKTRPTSDRLRETLFNVLAPRIEGAVFADLFAGTGAVGIEALSRGARRVYFAENARLPLVALRGNLEKLGIQAEEIQAEIGTQTEVEPAGALPLLRRLLKQGTRLDIVFMDPPYSDDLAYQSTLEFLAEQPILSAAAVVVAEHSRRVPLPGGVGRLQALRVVEQGEASLTFFRCNKSS